ANLLRARLRQERPGREPVLHRNAAVWHEDHGLADDAVRHAVAAGEMIWAARLIERHFDELFYLRGEGGTLQRGVAVLPRDRVRSRPRLLVAQAALADASGRVEAVEGLLDDAEAASADASDEPYEPSAGKAASLLVNVPATIAIFRAYLAELGGDGEGTAAFSSPAPARIRQGRRVLGFITPGPFAV